MNGSHGGNTPFLATKDIKGASEVVNDGKECTVWQKVYQQKTRDPRSIRPLAGELDTFGGTS
jgi:hypothetical protein